MLDINSVLYQIAQWKYLITADLIQAFYQIPLSQKSMKYCGVLTPYRGASVYVRSAMGMPGCETALEELMCRILGELLIEDIIVHIDDYLYCGAHSAIDLLQNRNQSLSAMKKCDLCLPRPNDHHCAKDSLILGLTVARRHYLSQSSLQCNIIHMLCSSKDP